MCGFKCNPAERSRMINEIDDVKRRLDTIVSAHTIHEHNTPTKVT